MNLAVRLDDELDDEALLQAQAEQEAERKRFEMEAAWLRHARAEGNCLETSRSPALRRKLAEAQNWRCCYCGCRMTDEGGHGNGPRQATFEHVVPRALGGADREWNLVIACRLCNNTRGHDLTPDHYAAAVVPARTAAS